MIAVVNKSSLVPDAAFRQMVGAVATQLWFHAAPAWNRTGTTVRSYPDEASAPAKSTVILLMDDADQAGDLGWHTEDAQGRVFGRVFVRPVLSNGGTLVDSVNCVAAVLSHEVLEAFIDPTCMLWADRGDQHQAVAYEICDPVEEQSYPLTVKGVTTYVSNFVYPAWFDAQALVPQSFDYMGSLKKPLELTSGGYVVMVGEDGTPKNIYGEQRAEWRMEMKASPLARTARRMSALL